MTLTILPVLKLLQSIARNIEQV